MLKILLLGPPAILFDDSPLAIQRRQVRTLLYFLAAKPEGVERSDLLIHFWPNTDESTARRQLRELLSKLRSQIPGDEILKTDHDRIWLNKDAVYVDMLHFQSLIQPAQNYVETNRKNNVLPDNLVEMLERAVDLWRAPAFLAGARVSNIQEFDDFMEKIASSLELAKLQSLERLANHFADVGELEKAIVYIKQALEVDIYNEVLQNQLNDLYYKTGRGSEAQSFYSYLKKIYQQDFDDIPPQSLRMTMDSVSHLPIVNKKTAQAGNPINKSSGRILIGRVKELEAMNSAYEQGGVILVNGEVGSGKTHFVRYFCSTIEDKPRVLYIHCRAEDENLPLQPFINMIREFINREDWEKLDTRWLQALSLLVPDIIRKTSTIQPLSEWPSAEARLELFEALYQLLISCSRSSRIVLVLDDFQWSDIDTLQALMYLSRQKLFTNFCFLVMVSRLEIQNPRIHHLLLSDGDHQLFSKLTLKPFSPSETGNLAEQILGKEPSLDFTRRLHKATGGNPLFITETLSTLIEIYGEDHPFRQEEIPLAESLFDIIREKQEHLNDISIDILSAAAVCGMEFQYDVLEYLHLCSPDLLVKGLEELEEKQFIHPTTVAGSTRQYAFNHNLLRDSLLKQLSLARECRLHEQIANAKSSLRGAQSNRQASIIARHFEAAGKPTMAFQFWIKAGQYARGLFSIDEAYGAFAKANTIRIEYIQSIPEADLYNLFSEWGDLAYNLMDAQALDECYSAMYETGVQIGSMLLSGAGLSGLALSALFNLEIDKSLTLLEQGLQILDQTDNLFEKIQVRSRYGMVLSTGGQNGRAIEAYEDAIRLGEGFPSQMIRQAVTIVQFQLSLLYSLLGWPQKAKEIGKLGMRNAYLLVSKPATQSTIHLSLAVAEYFSGNFDESLKYIHQSQKLVENMQNLRILTLMQILEARINCIKGQLDTAWDLARKALTIATDNHYFENVSEAHCVMGDIYHTLRIFDEAIREYTLGSDNLIGTHPGLNNYFRLGYSRGCEGDVEDGLQILEKSIAISTQLQLGSVSIPARYVQALLLDKSGNHEEAKSIFDMVMNEVQSRGLSLLTFPGSTQKSQYVWDTMENSMIEQVFNNLIKNKVIKPGEWIERVLASVGSHRYSEQFDFQRFSKFLRSLQEETGK